MMMTMQEKEAGRNWKSGSKGKKRSKLKRGRRRHEMMEEGGGAVRINFESWPKTKKKGQVFFFKNYGRIVAAVC